MCQLIQLARLLQLTEVELNFWDPTSPTSVACQWVRKNCGAGRNKAKHILHSLPMDKTATTLRTLRDPKVHQFRGVEAVKPQGVVALNRADGYSAHPDFGVWAEAKSRSDKGGHHNQLERARLSEFVDGKEKEIECCNGFGELDIILSEACIDVLPPHVL